MIRQKHVLENSDMEMCPKRARVVLMLLNLDAGVWITKIFPFLPLSDHCRLMRCSRYFLKIGSTPASWNKRVNLEGKGALQDDKMEHLRKYPLNNLAIYDGEVTDQGLLHLTGFTLKYFTMRGFKKITDHGVSVLIQPCLESLDLSNCSRITGLFLSLAMSSSFRRLNLSETNITDDEMIHLVRLHSLTYLDLSCCKGITDNGFRRLGQLPSLTHLSIWGCSRITDNGMTCLAKLQSLSRLDISYCKEITDNGIRHLAQLHSLTYLDLSCCEGITDNGMKHLSRMQSLTYLDISWCEITDQGLAPLADTALEYLNLHDIRINGEGLKYLKKLPLKKLFLSRCGEIVDDMLVYLTELPLEHLCLYHCKKITDAGLDHLSRLPLVKLSLGGCMGITDKGLRKLDHLHLHDLDMKD